MSGFKVLVIRAKGAVGRELIELLLNSENYSKISIIVRRKIKKWNNADLQKLNTINVDTLDFLITDLSKIKELIPDIESYNSVKKNLEKWKKPMF